MLTAWQAPWPLRPCGVGHVPSPILSSCQEWDGGCLPLGAAWWQLDEEGLEGAARAPPAAPSLGLFGP
eukprot:4839390-Alexandrium_andersonii.AAC.1